MTARRLAVARLFIAPLRPALEQFAAFTRAADAGDLFLEQSAGKGLFTRVAELKHLDIKPGAAMIGGVKAPLLVRADSRTFRPLGLQVRNNRALDYSARLPNPHFHYRAETKAIRGPGTRALSHRFNPQLKEFA